MSDHPAEDAAPRDSERFRRLPPQVRLEDMVEEVPAQDPPTPDPGDPNREVAWRWGIGIAPGG